MSKAIYEVDGAGKLVRYKKMYETLPGGLCKLIKGYVVEPLATYTLLEYIESNGTQYINTGFNQNQDTRIVMDVLVTDNTVTSFLFGSRPYSSGAGRSVFIISRKMGVDYGKTANRMEIPVASLDTSQRMLIDYDGNTLNVNDIYTKEWTAEEFSVTYPVYLLTCNTGGSISGTPASARLYGCRIYDAGVLVRDYVPCRNMAGAAGLWERVEGKFYTNAGSGTFGEGPETGAIERTGVTRLFYSLETRLTYNGTANDGIAVIQGAGVSFGKYALFAGGDMKAAAYPYTPSCSSAAYAYDGELTKQSITQLQSARGRLCGGQIGRYAVFAGGRQLSNAGTGLKTVDAYDENLTRSGSEMKYARGQTTYGKPICAAVGKHLIIADGTDSTNVLDVFDDELTLTNAISLSTLRYAMAAASNGKHAIFAGGGLPGAYTTPTRSALVDAFDDDLTRSTPTALSVERYEPGAARAGEYVVVAGGFGGTGNGSGRVKTVDAYDKDLTRTVPAELSRARFRLAATSLKEHALFPDGEYLAATFDYNAADAYDDELTLTTFADQIAYRHYGMSAAVGDYALLVGGSPASSGSGTPYFTNAEIFKAEYV